jgi:two-component system sensor histidine kinase/response regulator
MSVTITLETPASLATGPLIDRTSILDRVGGDEELLRDITAIFLEEYPELISEIRAATETADAERLERAAHSLKGSVSNFGAAAATRAAFQLEMLGRKGQLEPAPRALNDLLSEFRLLLPELERLAA